MSKINYAIEYVGGGQVTEISVDSERDALAAVEERFPGCVIGDQWDAEEPGHSRKLIWASEEDADNDSGAKAVAHLTRDRDA